MFTVGVLVGNFVKSLIFFLKGRFRHPSNPRHSITLRAADFPQNEQSKRPSQTKMLLWPKLGRYTVTSSAGLGWISRIFLSNKFPRRRQWHPTLVLLPGESHGRRSLVGCRPWGHEESETTERLHFHFSLSGIGEGNCNPLQCSCLENPRNGGAW